MPHGGKREQIESKLVRSSNGALKSPCLPFMPRPQRLPARHSRMQQYSIGPSGKNRLQGEEPRGYAVNPVRVFSGVAISFSCLPFRSNGIFASARFGTRGHKPPSPDRGPCIAQGRKQMFEVVRTIERNWRYSGRRLCWPSLCSDRGSTMHSELTLRANVGLQLCFQLFTLLLRRLRLVFSEFLNASYENKLGIP